MAKKPGYAMSLWLHGKEDYISEAGAMNMFVIKQAEDGCEWLAWLFGWESLADYRYRIHHNVA
jgi:hypothetical protein